MLIGLETALFHHFPVDQFIDVGQSRDILANVCQIDTKVLFEARLQVLEVSLDHLFYSVAEIPVNDAAQDFGQIIGGGLQNGGTLPQGTRCDPIVESIFMLSKTHAEPVASQ